MVPKNLEVGIVCNVRSVLLPFALFSKYSVVSLKNMQLSTLCLVVTIIFFVSSFNVDRYIVMFISNSINLKLVPMNVWCMGLLQ